jgi:nitrite reductase (NADH) small subunit
MSWLDVGALGVIPIRGARVLATAAGPVAVFRTGANRVFALRDRCPHRGGPLSQGIVHGDCVTCPLHDWVIDLESGAARAPDEGCVETFPVRVESGRVLIDLGTAGIGDVADAAAGI